MTETTETDTERPPNATQAVLTALRELYHENPDADSMDKDDTLTRAVENVERLTRSDAEDALDTLLRRGECYYPRKGDLRLTNPPETETTWVRNSEAP
jgi:DNA replicative helicase MCM subunit Mcm2 (Cdc46/Mcm family)